MTRFFAKENELGRREFIKRTVQAATVTAVSAGVASGDTSKQERAETASPIPTCFLGRTKARLPILGEALKGVRDHVYLVTKVETTVPAKVRGAVEKSLKELQTDHLHALLIHGTPGVEQMTVKQSMKIHAELVKLRDEGIVRFLGLSTHSYFDKRRLEQLPAATIRYVLNDD